MVSGIGTSSGFEERIRFSEIEIVDANAIDTGVLHNMPEGNYINGYDVNIPGVRVTTSKGKIRTHKHAEFLLRIKTRGELEHFVARRYGDFNRLHRRLRFELPGRALPALPQKNKSDSTATGLLGSWGGGGEDPDSDAESISSGGTRKTREAASSLLTPGNGAYKLPLERPAQANFKCPGHRKGGSSSSIRSGLSKSRGSPRLSADGRSTPLSKEPEVSQEADAGFGKSREY